MATDYLQAISELCYKGKPLPELTREEALEAIVVLYELHEKSREDLKQVLDFYAPKRF